MSVWEILRTKQMWVALAVSLGVLLALWALGAMLISKGTLSQDGQPGWIAGSYLAAGLAGGWIAGRKKKGSMTYALAVAVLLIAVSVLLAWILFSGISFAGGGWKNVLCIVAGCLLAGFMTAGRRGGKVRRKGLPAAQKKLPLRR